MILFDEIEKAHPDVFNILLQVLDDGHITDAQGRKINFKNTIIIMTSNAGAQSIIEPKALGFASVEDAKHNYDRMKDSVMEEVRRIFKPEFLNRIDETIVTLLAGHGAREYGARPLRRMIQNKIEDSLAEEILSGRIKQGDFVEAAMHKKEVSFTVKKEK